MRAKQTEHGTKLWISAAETYEWANRIGASWPCSTLANKRLFIEFESNGDLVDYAVDNRSGDLIDIDGAEITAIASDFLRERFGPGHFAIRE